MTKAVAVIGMAAALAWATCAVVDLTVELRRDVFQVGPSDSRVDKKLTRP